jgi:hypothetical protein
MHRRPDSDSSDPDRPFEVYRWLWKICAQPGVGPRRRALSFLRIVATDALLLGLWILRRPIRLTMPNKLNRSPAGLAMTVLGFGFVWALGWSVAWTGVQFLLASQGLSRPVDPTVTPMMGALMGFYGGTIFGTLLSAFENGREIHSLPRARVGARGAVAGLFIPVVYQFMRGGEIAVVLIQPWWVHVLVASLGVASAFAGVMVARLVADSIKVEMVRPTSD